MTRKIEVEILGDVSGLSKAFGDATGKTSKLGSALTTLGKAAAVGLAALGAGAVVAGAKMVTMAGNAAEVDSKMKVVFGKELPGLKKNLDAFADATGASSFKLREQAADMGALLGPLVGTKKGASEMSEQFVKLATDLGSFNNVPVEEALLAIRSGLVGEAEPLRRFGVLLNEAAVKSEALRMGLVKGKEELTEQQKVMARGSLIMKQTTQAQDDATRTAGSYTNQMKALKNTVTDVATGLGVHLLPAATAVASGLNDFINKISDADGASAKFGVALDSLKTIASDAAVGIVAVFNKVDWSKTWDKLIASADTVASRLRDALDQKLGAVDWGNVGGRIADGISAAISTTGAIGKKIADVVGAAMRSVDWVAFGRAAGPGLATALVVAFATLMDVSFWAKNWDLALAVALAVFGKGIGKIVAPIGTLFKKLGADAVLAITEGLEANSPKLAAALLAVLTKLPAIVAKGLALLIAPVTKVFGQLGRLAQFTVKVLGISAAINAIVQFSQAVIQKLADLVTGAILGGYEIGKGIVQGMINGLASLAGALWAKAAGLAEGAISAAKKKLHIESPSKIFESIGADTVRGFILGITTQQPALAGKMAEAIGKALDAARAIVEKYQVSFGDAFSKLGDFAKRAFDAKTQSLLDSLDKKFDAKIAKWQAFGAALTPAEKAIAALDAAEQQRSRDSAIASAKEQLAKAQAMEAGAERDAALLAAMESMRQAELSITRAKLEEKAVVERTAQEASAAAHIVALEATKAREAQNLEERRTQLGDKLSEQLATLQQRLSKHPEEYDKIQKQIQKLLASYGIPMQKAGENLGKAFARGIRNSIDEAVAAAKALAKAVAQYLPHSPAEKGPLSKPIDWKGYLTAGMPSGGALAGMASGMVSGMSGGGAPRVAMAGPAASGGGTVVNNFHFPHYVGAQRELVNAVRDEVQRTIARNK